MSNAPSDVEAMFETTAQSLIDAGWKRFSADAILHRIRWHYGVEQGDRKRKVNNNWSSELARRFMERYPQYRGFFEVRQLKRGA